MKKNKKIILIIIILLTLVFSSQISSFARYSSNYVWNYYLESHGFYLVSDSLGLDKKTPLSVLITLLIRKTLILYGMEVVLHSILKTIQTII